MQNSPQKPTTPSPRLFDQVRNKIRFLHYAYTTEKTYLMWIERFVRFHRESYGKSLPLVRSEKLQNALVARQIDADNCAQNLSQHCATGGFEPPVQFFQSGLIHAWFARRTA